MSGIHVRFEILPEDFLAHLSEAAYGVALRHGFAVPFFELELDLLKALREVIRRDMSVADQCGATEICRQAHRAEPWSQKADLILGTKKEE